MATGTLQPGYLLPCKRFPNLNGKILDGERFSNEADTIIKYPPMGYNICRIPGHEQRLYIWIEGA